MLLELLVRLLILVAVEAVVVVVAAARFICLARASLRLLTIKLFANFLGLLLPLTPIVRCEASFFPRSNEPCRLTAGSKFSAVAIIVLFADVTKLDLFVELVTLLPI